MKGSRSIIAAAIALGLLASSSVAVTAQEELAGMPVEFTGQTVEGEQPAVPEAYVGTEWISAGGTNVITPDVVAVAE